MIAGRLLAVSTSTGPATTDEGDAVTATNELPTARIGMLAGLTGILCCVGPTVLAMVGVVSAGTAYAWANTLYDGYAWLFRLAGLLVLAGLITWSLERRNQCTLAGAGRVWPKLALSLGIAVLTYALLYALTTWLGTFA